MVPSLSVATARKVTVPPMPVDAVTGVITSERMVAAGTVTVAVALKPRAVALMVAVPAASARTRPAALTLADPAVEEIDGGAAATGGGERQDEEQRGEGGTETSHGVFLTLDSPGKMHPSVGDLQPKSEPLEPRSTESAGAPRPVLPRGANRPK